MFVLNRSAALTNKNVMGFRSTYSEINFCRTYNLNSNENLAKIQYKAFLKDNWQTLWNHY